MKFVHISDLHLGKRLYGFSLLEDQKFILDKVIEIIDDEKPDAVLIAGDIYDKPVPLVQAVELFDSFIVRLSARKVQTFIISGNHDSAGRLSFGGRLMDAEGVHISPAYAGKASSFSLEDEYGPVDIFLLPFLKPQTAAPFFEEEMGDYSSCLRAAIRRMDIRPGVRKVLIAHQFVTGASRSDSEEVNVGGLDNVDAAVFEDFDYVALGHIHSPQNVGDPRIRYCGTPLKYSFSEAGQKKSVTVAELGPAESGRARLKVRTRPLSPLRDMVEIKGSYDRLVSTAFYQDLDREAYYHVTLTDEDDILGALGRMRTVYPNIMNLDYDNKRTRAVLEMDRLPDPVQETPLDTFMEFYQNVNGTPMSQEQRKVCGDLIEKIWQEGGEKL